jgi:hypothetical protein
VGAGAGARWWGGLDVEGVEAAAGGGVELVDGVGGALGAAGAAGAGFVGEGVGEVLDGVAGGDGVAVEVELAVDFGEGHGVVVAGPHGEGAVAEVFAVEGVGVLGTGWDGGWSGAAGVAESLGGFGAVDAGPHGDVEGGELGADVGELVGEVALGGVEGVGLVEQGVDFGVVGGEGGGAVWGSAPVAAAVGFFGGRHGCSRGVVVLVGGSKTARWGPAARTVEGGCATNPDPAPTTRVNDSFNESPTRTPDQLVGSRQRIVQRIADTHPEPATRRSRQRIVQRIADT